MKVAVIYSSLTGNTKKLAEGVFNNIPDDYEKVLYTDKDSYDISDCDVVIPTFWVDRSNANKSMKEVISSLKNKKVFLLGTMGFFPDSQHGIDCINNASRLVDSSCSILGYFLCNGKIDIKLLENVQKMKAESIGEKAFKAHMLDERNLLRYRILGEHTNDLDVEYASARVNERLLIESEIEKLSK